MTDKFFGHPRRTQDKQIQLITGCQDTYVHHNQEILYLISLNTDNINSFLYLHCNNYNFAVNRA